MNVSLIAAWLFAATAVVESARDAGLTIRFASDGKQVQVLGLPDETLAALGDVRLTRTKWRRILWVGVARAGSAPMLGAYAVDDNVLVFTPRFPLQTGLEYRAVLNPSALPGNPIFLDDFLEVRHVLPKAGVNGPAAEVAGIYPSGEALPANLLKFYIHFTAPMSRGDSYRHIHLTEADGREVLDGFLELGEELWDRQGMRLTVLFDPGRIKRGLRPNEEVGAPLVAGQRCRLVVDSAWQDAQGKPLGKGYVKEFHVTSEDVVQPDPQRWKVGPPANGTRQALSIEFDEPLDRALAERLIAVYGADGRRVAGRTSVGDGETRWSFVPQDDWKSGAYQIEVDAAIEDRSGNSVGRPFEVREGQRDRSGKPVILHFEVPRSKVASS